MVSTAIFLSVHPHFNVPKDKALCYVIRFPVVIQCTTAVQTLGHRLDYPSICQPQRNPGLISQYWLSPRVGGRHWMDGAFGRGDFGSVNKWGWYRNTWGFRINSKAPASYLKEQSWEWLHKPKCNQELTIVWRNPNFGVR